MYLEIKEKSIDIFHLKANQPEKLKLMWTHPRCKFAFVKINILGSGQNVGESLMLLLFFFIDFYLFIYYLSINNCLKFLYLGYCFEIILLQKGLNVVFRNIWRKIWKYTVYTLYSVDSTALANILI